MSHSSPRHANPERSRHPHPLRQVRAEFYSPLDESLQGVTVELAAADAALTFASPIPTAKVGGARRLVSRQRSVSSHCMRV